MNTKYFIFTFRGLQAGSSPTGAICGLVKAFLSFEADTCVGPKSKHGERFFNGGAGDGCSSVSSLPVFGLPAPRLKSYREARLQSTPPPSPGLQSAQPTRRQAFHIPVELPTDETNEPITSEVYHVSGVTGHCGRFAAAGIPAAGDYRCYLFVVDVPASPVRSMQVPARSAAIPWARRYE